MNSFMLYKSMTAADFATDHKILNMLLEGLKSLSQAFGGLADALYSIDVNAGSSNIATALTGIGAGLVTFFMVLEIVTFCFNVDFHSGFESGLKIGVRMVLLYIVVENCMDAADIVIGIFKMQNTVNFTDNFAKVVKPFESMTEIPLATSGLEKYVEPLLVGVVLSIANLAVIIVFSMLIISMVGIIAETAILTAIAPVACATLVNGQVRQTGITFLKNLAAISMQWGVIALCFDVFKKVTEEMSKAGLDTLGDSLGTGSVIITSIFTFLAPLIGLVALATMISKSGDITKRALGA